MRQSWIAMFLLLAVALVCLEIGRHEAEAGTTHRRVLRKAQKLCSSNLSDALYLVCKPHGGFNGQFSASGDVEGAGGIVDECCYKPCTIEVIEQYCKAKDKTR